MSCGAQGTALLVRPSNPRRQGIFKRLFRGDGFRAGLAWLVGWYMAFVARTTSWEIEGREHIIRWATGSPAIVAFWHESLPASLPMIIRQGKLAGRRKPGVVLASQHRDGQLIGHAAGYFGLGMVLGSSSKGGASGLRNLIAALRGGSDVGITPDGPRGPRRAAAPGLAQLAALTGAPVLPCAAWTRWGITLNSWDRMRIPLPFGRGRMVCHEMIAVPREAWQELLPEIEAALTRALQRSVAAG